MKKYSKTKHKNGPSGSGSGSLHMSGKGKRTICTMYLPPTDLVMEEDIKDLLKQLPASMILLGDFNAYNPLCGSEKMSTGERKSSTDSTSCAETKKKKPTTEHTMTSNQQ